MSRTQTKRSGFDRLRIAALGAGASAMALGLLGQAAAAPVGAGTTVSTGGATWDFTNSADGPWDDALGFALLDASTTGGGVEAFDDALVTAVNGRVFKDPTGQVDVSSVPGGQELTTGVVEYEVGSKVRVQQKLFMLGNKEILRQLIFFRNTGPNPVRFTAAVGHELGSDTNTRIVDTFSGDKRLDPWDRWMITSDDASTPDCDVNLCVTFGRGNRRNVGLVVLAPGLNPTGSGDVSQSYEEAFDVRVPGNDYKIVMLFYGVSDTPELAERHAKKMASPQNAQRHGLLRNMPDGWKQRVINWRGL